IEVEPIPRFNWRNYKPEELATARAAHQQAIRDRRKRILKLAREHGSKVACYDLRHGFCQRLLESGANHLAVAELMGHSTGRMVSETYSHMNRATSYRAKGWLIGSGPVEAACKQVVGQRMKGCGMRWGEQGADAICHLRALFRSEKGQWDAY